MAEYFARRMRTPVVKIDTAAAKRLPGVKAVVTAVEVGASTANSV